MNVELRMWNFELVARRAMKNYSIKNYLASYSIFLLVSPSLLGFLSPGNGGTEGGIKTIEGWERLFYSIFSPKPYGSNLFREKPRHFVPVKTLI